MFEGKTLNINWSKAKLYRQIVRGQSFEEQLGEAKTLKKFVEVKTSKDKLVEGSKNKENQAKLSKTKGKPKEHKEKPNIT